MVLAGLIRNTALCLVVSRNAGVIAYSAAMIYSLAGVSLGVLLQLGTRIWGLLRTDRALSGTESNRSSLATRID